MFITNNSDSFHLWLKKNLIKHQKSQNIMTMAYSIIRNINNGKIMRYVIYVAIMRYAFIVPL